MPYLCGLWRFANAYIIFDVRGDVVNVVGIFHQLENYPNKL